MRKARAWFWRLGSLFNKQSRERELAEELEAHVQLHIEDNLRAGMTRAEARRQALIKLGGIDQTKEIYRDRRGIPTLETVMHDVRYALRMLRKNPGFTAVAVLTLALGIGANTAIFSLFDTVMLRLLPVQKPEELVLVQWHDPLQGDEGSRLTNSLWEQLRDRQDVLSGVFASGWGQEDFDLAQGGAVQHANGLFTSGSYFRTLGVRPATGRLFNAADDQRGCPSVAVLSYGFWQDHFGGEQSAVGKVLSLNHHPFQIIGASAPGFYGIEVGYKFDVAVPICAAPVINEHRQLDQRSGRWLRVIGRVKPGVNRQQLKARLAMLSPQITAGALPVNSSPQGQQHFLRQILVIAPAATGIPDLGRQFEEPLHILMAVVGLVLLIACANIASLMLARAASRRKEIAVRRALGASRVRLIRQLLTECILLSSAGALVGVLFARWGAALLVRYLSTVQHQVFLDLSLDSRVLGFTAAIAVLTGILFGVFPAFRSTRVSLTAAMKGSDAVETERHERFHAGKWIVSLQVALSLVLLVAAGLFLRSFEKLATLDIGFDRNNVLLVNANLEAANVPPGPRLQTYQEIEKRLRALPGAISASRSVITPISDEAWTGGIRSDSSVALTGHDVVAFFNFISPGYFETLRIPLLAGRNFNGLDAKTAPRVAIVNQTFARRFYPSINPVGRYFRTGPSDKPWPPIQIVGLLKDSNYVYLREETHATAFLPITQLPGNDASEHFELRTATPPAALAHLVERTIAEVNKGISVESHTLIQQVDDSMVKERLLAMLSCFFAIMALLLAGVGLYGTFSYLVTQRQKEFGLCLALGAQPGSIVRLVMRDLVTILVGGVMAGVCVSLASVRVLQSMLFGLEARDTVTLIAAVGVLSAVALVAGYLPARRATKVDPMVALRYE